MLLLTIPIYLFSSIIINNVAYAVDIHLSCNANGFQCLNETAFIICVDIGNDILVPSPDIESCPKEFECVDNFDVPCQEIPTTDKPMLTKKAVFRCTKEGRFPTSNCRRYYECEDIVFWYQLKLKICPRNLWFNQYSQKCVLPKYSRCEQSEDY